MFSGFIYDGLEMIFGSGVMGDLTAFISEVLDGVSGVMDNGIMSTFYNIFISVSASLFIIFFVIEIISQASKDLVTIDKITVLLIRFITGFVVLLCLKDFVSGTVKFGAGILAEVSSDSMKKGFEEAKTKGITFYFGEDKDDVQSTDSGYYDKFPEWADVKEAFEEEYDEGGSPFLPNMSGVVPAFTLMIPAFLLMIAKGAGYLTCISVAVLFIARCLMSPIAVVQCFEEGTRSSGIRYLKKLVAMAITFAVMIIVIMAGNALTGTLMVNRLADAGITQLKFSNISEVLSFSNLAFLCLPNAVMIAGVMGAGKIADDVMGVH